MKMGLTIEDLSTQIPMLKQLVDAELALVNKYKKASFCQIFCKIVS